MCILTYAWTACCCIDSSNCRYQQQTSAADLIEVKDDTGAIFLTHRLKPGPDSHILKRVELCEKWRKDHRGENPERLYRNAFTCVGEVRCSSWGV